MDRMTDLQNMPAPPVGSGKNADTTWCAARPVARTPAENEKNSTKEYVPPAPTIGKKGALKG